MILELSNPFLEGEGMRGVAPDHIPRLAHAREYITHRRAPKPQISARPSLQRMLSIRAYTRNRQKKRPDTRERIPGLSRNIAYGDSCSERYQSARA